MATDGPDPTRCSPEIFESGSVAGIYETYGANAFEALIQQVSRETGLPVDWHYVGGRAVVKTLGDLATVQAALKRIVEPEIQRKREEFLDRIR